MITAFNSSQGEPPVSSFRPPTDTNQGLQGWLRSALSDAANSSPRALAYAAIFAVALVLAWLSWARWGGIQMDCGRELYVPAQILRGKLLYRDLWYPFGPLAPYVEALLLDLFGLRLLVLYLFGLTMAVACALVMYELGVLLEGPMVGLTAAIVLLLQGVRPVFFNYVFPYGYAATLGLLLTLLCALLATRYVLARHGHNLMLAGVMAGLALLCKQEMGATCYVMLVLVLAIEAVREQSFEGPLRGAAACAPGVALAALVYGWFFWRLTPSFILLHNWTEFPGSYAERTVGPRWNARLGLRFVPSELLFLVLDGTCSLGLWLWVAKGRRHSGGARFAVAVLLCVVALAGLRCFGVYDVRVRNATELLRDLFMFPRGMYFIVCGFFAYALHEVWKTSGDRRCLAQAAFGLFALVLSVRVLAQVVPFGYDIFYTTPLFLSFIVAIVSCIRVAMPALDDQERRAVVNSVLSAAILGFVVMFVPIGSSRTVLFRTNWGGIYVQPEVARSARRILAFMSAQKERGRRVVVVPELPIMYALTGTSAPSRWYILTPGILSPAEENDYIADLGRNVPDYIILTNRNTSEYGMPYFGLDYDRRIYRWIQTHYHRVGQFGNFQRNGSKILAALLYQRNNVVESMTDRVRNLSVAPRASAEFEFATVPVRRSFSAPPTLAARP